MIPSEFSANPFFQKSQDSSAFSSLNSNINVASKINKVYSKFFKNIFWTVNGRVPKIYMVSRDDQ